MKLYIALLVALCCIGYGAAVTISNEGGGTVYKLSVVQDVWLESPTTNYNHLDILITGQIPLYPNKRSLLQFEDLPPECGTIEWAKMYVNYRYSHRWGQASEENTPWIPRPTEIYQVRRPWVDSEATSSLRETGELWDTPWLDLTGTDAGPDVLDSVTLFPLHPVRTFKEFDVTCAVQAWHNGDENHGVLMRAANEDILGRSNRWFSDAEANSEKHAFINVLCDNPFSSGQGNKCPTDPETTTSTTTDPPTTEAGATTCEDVRNQCPTTWPAPHTLLPHPTNCGRYCRCDHNGAYIWDMPCPAGLEFNAALMICLWPWQSGCNKK